MKKLSFAGIFFIIFFSFSTSTLFAQNCEDIPADRNNIGQKITCLEGKLTQLSSQANTLKNQIAQFDAQIKLTALKIAETEDRISLLGGRIDQLEVSLTSLTSAFASRAVETYKMSRLRESFLFLISAEGMSDAVSRYHYLQRIQEADRSLLEKLQTAQTTYKSEKSDQEDLQVQLSKQKANLDKQKAAKAQLLTVTKNNEKKYQELLAQAQAEYKAIQDIIAGRGVETEVGKVSEGQKIATIIQGSSCNSSGSHVHFIVSQNASTLNPFNYLRGGVDYENCSGSSCGGSDGDVFNPSGSWNWPISPKIKFAQGYGSTWATKYSWVGRIYQFHNGIDINSDSSEIRAVKSGTLYRGGLGGSGCMLRYVRVRHDEAGLDTYYLHVNY